MEMTGSMSGKKVSSRGDDRAFHMRLIDLLRAGGATAGDLVPGELELAERLGVSRPQVREGLRVLEMLGVLSGRQGSRRVWRGFDPGAFGRHLAITLEPSARGVTELLQIRQVLETSLLPRVLDSIAPADLLELRALADQMVARANRTEPFHQQDQQFHMILFRCLNNEVLSGLLDAFWAVLSNYPGAPDPDDTQLPMARMHGEILDAIEAADSGLATHLLQAHFYGIRSRLPLSPGRSSHSPETGGAEGMVLS
jgi:DNA-binding FadR family transcriptional regulator